MSVSERGLSEPISRVPRRTPFTIRFSPEFMSGMNGDIGGEQTSNKLQAGTVGLLFGRVYDDVVIVNTCKLLNGEELKTDPFPGGLLAALKANLPFSTDLIGWCRICAGSSLVESDFDFHNRHFRRASDIAVALQSKGSAGLSAEIYTKSLGAKLSNENCRRSSQYLPAIASPDILLEANLRRPIDPSIYLRAYEATDGFVQSKSRLSSLTSFVRSALTFGARENNVSPVLLNSTKRVSTPKMRLPVAALFSAEAGIDQKLGPAALQKMAVAPGLRKWTLLAWAIPAAIAAGVLVGIALGVKFRSGEPVEARPSQTSAAAPAIAQTKLQPLAAPAASEPAVAGALTSKDPAPGADLTTRPSSMNRETAKKKPLSNATRAATEMAKGRSVTSPLPAPRKAVAPEPERARTLSKPLEPAADSANPTLERVAVAQPSQLQRSTDSGNTHSAGVAAPSSQTESMRKAEPPPVATGLKPVAPPGPVSGEAYLPARPLRQVVPATRGSGLMIFKEMVVEVQATVSAQGRVTATQPIQGPGKVSQQVIGAAIKAAEDWRFQPATLRGQPVESKYTIVFRFLPQDR